MSDNKIVFNGKELELKTGRAKRRKPLAYKDLRQFYRVIKNFDKNIKKDWIAIDFSADICIIEA